jgi:hypothetical protein
MLRTREYSMIVASYGRRMNQFGKEVRVTRSGGNSHKSGLARNTE